VDSYWPVGLLHATAVVLDTLSAGDRTQMQEVYSRSVMLLELGRRLGTNLTLFSTEARNVSGYALLTVFESRMFTPDGPNVPAEFDAPHFRSETPS
jgi:hypothetical protein